MFKNYADGGKSEQKTFMIIAFQDVWVEHEKDRIKTEKRIPELAVQHLGKAHMIEASNDCCFVAQMEGYMVSRPDAANRLSIFVEIL